MLHSGNWGLEWALDRSSESVEPVTVCSYPSKLLIPFFNEVEDLGQTGVKLTVQVSSLIYPDCQLKRNPAFAAYSEPKKMPKKSAPSNVKYGM